MQLYTFAGRWFWHLKKTNKKKHSKLMPQPESENSVQNKKTKTKTVNSMLFFIKNIRKKRKYYDCYCKIKIYLNNWTAWAEAVNFATALKHGARSKTFCEENSNKIQTIIIIIIRVFELTLHIIICFPTGDPLSSLKAPVVRIRQHNFHKDVVMSREVETCDVKTEEWKHASAKVKEKRGKSGLLQRFFFNKTKVWTTNLHLRFDFCEGKKSKMKISFFFTIVFNI